MSSIHTCVVYLFCVCVYFGGVVFFVYSAVHKYVVCASSLNKVCVHNFTQCILHCVGVCVCVRAIKYTYTQAVVHIRRRVTFFQKPLNVFCVFSLHSLSLSSGIFYHTSSSLVVELLSFVFVSAKIKGNLLKNDILHRHAYIRICI